MLRPSADERNAITALGNAHMPTSGGRSIAFMQIAKVGFAWEPGGLWRERRNDAVTVQRDIVEGPLEPTVTVQVRPALQKIAAEMPPGYRIVVTGVDEESSKGKGSIAAGVPTVLFVMFTLLMLHLESFSRAMLIFLIGPLGIAGVAAVLLVLNRPFGSVALRGVIALMGMIIRNSVILITSNGTVLVVCRTGARSSNRPYVGSARSCWRRLLGCWR